MNIKLGDKVRIKIDSPECSREEPDWGVLPDYMYDIGVGIVVEILPPQTKTDNTHYRIDTDSRALNKHRTRLKTLWVEGFYIVEVIT